MVAKKPDALFAAVQRLSAVHTEGARIDGSLKTHYVKHAPLIAQLRLSVGGNVKGGGAGGNLPSQRTPIDPDALDKYLALTVKAQQWYLEWTGERAPIDEAPERTIAKAYLAFNRRNPIIEGDKAAEKYRNAVASMWESQCKLIEEKLSPPTKRELLGEKCPECGFDWYTVIINRGSASRDKRWKAWVDTDRLVALTVTYRADGNGGLSKSYVRCGCCESLWMGASGIRYVAYELENPQLIEEVEAVMSAVADLERCGISEADAIVAASTAAAFLRSAKDTSEQPDQP